MEIDSSPVEIDQLQRPVDRLKMEEMHLAKETDDTSVERLSLACRPGGEVRGTGRSTARWEAEKSGLNKVGDLRPSLDDLRTQADKLQREGRLRRRLQDSLWRHSGARKELAAADLGRLPRAPTSWSRRVGADDIAEVISSWTGIPGRSSPAGRDREAPSRWNRSSAPA